ncbi:hypothetical protein H072_6285 [Dactylellina haptotyla CBS 200.50]|uniref:Uncharacterized protein n=1 Tax=Dactylellina haptotyla (strain CBS 200.50) TaxID=1284197 RepID=S8AA54_DACHA|nr:hypothetical protein H072_6285 [Dactylellina haptotyla CBS 200.50]
MLLPSTLLPISCPESDTSTRLIWPIWSFRDNTRSKLFVVNTAPVHFCPSHQVFTPTLVDPTMPCKGTPIPPLPPNTDERTFHRQRGYILRNWRRESRDFCILIRYVSWYWLRNTGTDLITVDVVRLLHWLVCEHNILRARQGIRPLDWDLIHQYITA